MSEYSIGGIDVDFKNIFVVCDNSEQAELVVSVAIRIGYKRHGVSDGYRSVLMNVRGSVFDYHLEPFAKSDFEYLNYQQFMEKYAMTDLKSKIEEAKNKTHMSLHQMSKAIGFNEHYLSGVVKRNRSESTQKKVIALLDDLIQKSQQELTHDFKGKALNTQVEDAMMISKAEYNSLKKEIDHKTQIAEKHADMRAKAEAEAQESNDKMLLAEKDSEKWQCDYWTVSRENIELTNSKRAISICLAVSILVIVVMLVFGVLHFNWVV